VTPFLEQQDRHDHGQTDEEPLRVAGANVINGLFDAASDRRDDRVE
jgi:hypothetical protein